MKMEKELIETQQNNIDCAIERCVMCNGTTEYMSSVPISRRNYYVEGAGQLCEKCYCSLYTNNRR